MIFLSVQAAISGADGRGKIWVGRRQARRLMWRGGVGWQSELGT